jgi:hypothetical protein
MGFHALELGPSAEKTQKKIGIGEWDYDLSRTASDLRTWTL